MKKIITLILAIIVVIATVFIFNENKQFNLASMHPQQSLNANNDDASLLTQKIVTSDGEVNNKVHTQKPSENLVSESAATIKNSEVFNGEKYKTLLFSEDFISEVANYISDNKTNESVENELYLQRYFFDSIQNINEFSRLSVEFTECDIDICLLSISGLEQLSEIELEQLENELLFNKEGLSKITAKGTGGTYGIFKNNGNSYFRVIYITNPKFSGIH